MSASVECKTGHHLREKFIFNSYKSNLFVSPQARPANLHLEFYVNIGRLIDFCIFFYLDMLNLIM